VAGSNGSSATAPGSVLLIDLTNETTTFSHGAAATVTL
jgi:hypothetical protein